ncbi:2-aminoethylphosphonate aminotransferase [Clostridium sp. BJN0001]|uniref:2-aminoethylphosphonate aminotransferase n=1 Tax=Clostridium sp. BJN0001 TaxID=2930219 RepID=UPI001FD5F168|nr:2-aminoethylphosphonate--pyruvate transaminase [Clostridium sp. BJN0001]
MKRNILLNPGPATTTDTVKNAQVVPDICPRENEFGKVMEYISKGITDFVGNNDEYITILFGGSGTAAVESMISSIADENSKMLIVDNGAYGKRMCDMAQIYNIDFVRFKSDMTKKIDLKKLENTIIENNGQITKLAIVHHETTTGILNDIESVGEICNKYNIDMIVDAMSSFAGIPIDMKKMNIKFLASSSNKCIQSMAGVSFVVAQKEALNKIKNIRQRNLYLNLYKQYEFFKENYQMRFTPPVQVLYALKQAVKEAKDETIEKRHERYVSLCKILWKGLKDLNLKKLIAEEDSSMLLTTIIEPKIKGYSFEKMHDYMISRGYTIYPGKIAAENTFRVANIGQIYEEDMQKFVELLKEYMRSIGA